VNQQDDDTDLPWREQIDGQTQEKVSICPRLEKPGNVCILPVDDRQGMQEKRTCGPGREAVLVLL
jgi:hypothetical protein